MTIRQTVIATLIIAVLLCAAIAFGGATAKTIRAGQTITLSGQQGYVDYLIFEPPQTLYAGFATRDTLVILDTTSNKVIGRIRGLKDLRSIAVVADLGIGFTSNRGEDSVGVIDVISRRLLRKIPASHGPDAILYDQAAKLVYVANHEGHSASLIDPVRQKVVATIPLGGAAEYAQADPATGLVYQNIEDTDEIAVVDPIKQAVVSRYQTAPGKEPTGLAIDPLNHRLFCACGNKKLIVMDEQTGKVVAVLPIGEGVDSVVYDPGLKRIYTANAESGTMTVIQQKSAEEYTVIEDVTTHKGGHALALDLVTHRIYLAHRNKISIYEAVMD